MREEMAYLMAQIDHHTECLRRYHQDLFSLLLKADGDTYQPDPQPPTSDPSH